MFESIRQWFFRRVSEPFLARIRAWFKAGPIAAVAIAELLTALGQLIAIGVTLVTFQVLGILSGADLLMRTSTVHVVVATAMAFYFLVVPAVISRDLLAVSRGEKHKLSPWTVGFAQSQERGWRHLPLNLAIVALNLPYLALCVVADAWVGIPLGLVIPGYFLIECVKSAIWQNQRVRGLVRASMPPDPF